MLCSDPYVKLQLLPEKQHKVIFCQKYLWIPTWTKENFQVKTRVVRRTLHPVYDEDFTFYGVHFNQLPVCIIILPSS